MLWLGIGLCIIGLALLVLAIIAIKPLHRLSDVLGSLKQTADELPKTLDEVSSQTTAAIQSGESLLQDARAQLKELQPIFVIIGKTARPLNTFTSFVLQKMESITKTNVFQETFKNRKSLFGLIALLFLIFKRKGK